MKLKQICVNLYGTKSKTFLASWKWSQLVDEKKLGAVVMYYLVNAIVDPAHSCFRYANTIYNKK